MKTLEEIEQLKANWQKYPCWDIETTEGFEDYKDELLAFRSIKEREWEAWRQKREAGLRRICPFYKAGFLACPGAPNPSEKPDLTKCDRENCAMWEAEMNICGLALQGILAGRALARSER